MGNIFGVVLHVQEKEELGGTITNIMLRLKEDVECKPGRTYIVISS